MVRTATVRWVSLALLCLLGTTASVFAASTQVTLREGTSFAVAVSADGAQLAFDLHGRIWTIPARGGRATALTGPLDDARLPVFSPDGRRIAYQAYADGNWHLWVVDAAGGSPTQLTKGMQDDRDAAWDPSGAYLYYSSDRTRRYQIWRVPISGGAAEQITDLPGNVYSPAPGADGQLAFLSRAPGRDGAYSVLVQDRAGAPARTVHESKVMQLAGLSWLAPTRLSFVAYDSNWAASITVLQAVDVRGGEPLALTAPDDDVFPFRASTDAAGHTFFAANGGIRVRAPQGTVRAVKWSAALDVRKPSAKRKQYDYFDTAERPVKGIVDPSLSPDGRSIAFGALGDLWLARQGAEPVPLTRDGSGNNAPAFSPDGRQLAFVSGRSGQRRLMLHDLVTGAQRSVSNTPGISSPVWSGDSQRILYMVGEGLGPARRAEVVDVATGAAVAPGGRVVQGGSPAGWSPDGRFVAAMVLDVGPSLYREGRDVIEVVSLADDRRHRVEPPAGRVFSRRDGAGPVWSPDGRHLAVLVGNDAWLIPLDGEARPVGEPRLLLRGVDSRLSWNGDGTELLAQSGTRLRKVKVDSGLVTEWPVALTWRQDVGSGRLVLRTGRLWDGVSRSYQRDRDVLVEGNRIVTVVPAASRRSREFGGRLIDATAQTVIPGLIDAHAHLPPSLRGDLQWLSYGVTTIRSPASEPFEMLESRETIASGRRPGTRLLFAGRPLDGSRIFYSFGGTVLGEEDIRYAVERAVELDLDLFKTYVRLPNNLQKLVIDLADANGLYVTTHELYPSMGLGARGKEHLKGTARDGYGTALSLRSRVYGDVPAILAKTGGTITPTLSLLVGVGLEAREHAERFDDPRQLTFSTAAERLSQKNFARYAYSDDVSILRASVAELGAALRRIVDGGGRIIAGTDCPLISCGPSLHNELEVATAGRGLEPYQALMSATSWAADAIGIGAQVGRIGAGKVADLVILDGDPLLQISDTRKVAAVIANGRYYTRQQLIDMSPLTKKE